MSKTKELIKSVPLFKAFTDEVINALDVCGREVKYPQEGIIIQENALGDEIYLIVDGRVRVTCSQDPHSSASDLIYLERGEIFGEMAMIENAPRSASVVAETDVLLKVWRASTWRELCEQYPKFGYQLVLGLARILCDRLRKTNANVTVLNGVLWGKAAR